MRMRRLQIALISALGIALLASVGMIFTQSKRLAQFERQREADLRSLREVREALRQSERRNADVTAKSQVSATQDRAVIAQRDATIQQLNTELSQAHTSLTALQRQLTKVRNESQQALALVNKRSQVLQEDWQSRLDTLQRQLSSTQRGLRDARRRIAALEVNNAKLQSERDVNLARASEREQLLNRLADLDRRRESYLNSIAERYRNLTNRFRTMSGMLDTSSRNNNNNPTAFSGAALDLIQNAIALTDTDLQHLSILNAQAFQLEKKLQKK
ncbi:MAG: hypothetical protein M1404_00310 [Acidobacteria bacterium]|nr:hypothetical protein [Acidobacteriota bacterium]